MAPPSGEEPCEWITTGEGPGAVVGPFPGPTGRPKGIIRPAADPLYLTALLLFLLLVPVEDLQKEKHHQKDQADLQG